MVEGTDVPPLPPGRFKVRLNTTRSKVFKLLFSGDFLLLRSVMSLLCSQAFGGHKVCRNPDYLQPLLVILFDRSCG